MPFNTATRIKHQPSIPLPHLKDVFHTPLSLHSVGHRHANPSIQLFLTLFRPRPIFRAAVLLQPYREKGIALHFRQYPRQQYPFHICTFQLLFQRSLVDFRSANDKHPSCPRPWRLVKELHSRRQRRYFHGRGIYAQGIGYAGGRWRGIRAAEDDIDAIGERAEFRWDAGICFAAHKDSVYRR